MRTGQVITRGFIRTNGKNYLVGEFTSKKAAWTDCMEMLGWLAEEGIKGKGIVSSKGRTIAGVATDLLGRN